MGNENKEKVRIKEKVEDADKEAAPESPPRCHRDRVQYCLEDDCSMWVPEEEELDEQGKPIIQDGEPVVTGGFCAEVQAKELSCEYEQKRLDMIEEFLPKFDQLLTAVMENYRPPRMGEYVIAEPMLCPKCQTPMEFRFEPPETLVNKQHAFWKCPKCGYKDYGETEAPEKEDEKAEEGKD